MSINLFLSIKDDIIEDIGFSGHGCAISKSVSSMMTEERKQSTKDQSK